jgi:hypothetical protein
MGFYAHLGLEEEGICDRQEPDKYHLAMGI